MASPHRPKRLGKFDLLARIAKGGMAEIYLARQQGVRGISRLVVVKRILPHLAEEPHFVKMFLEEARVAALIGHPNVVQIFEVGQDQENYFIAMEYIDGPTVAAICRTAHRAGKVVPHQVAAEIVAQACDGLHAAHELRAEGGDLLGLVHRDVSPQNLMLTRQGLVKLLDFGIAKAQDSNVKTRTGSIKGKYPYMSPEQCEGRALDRRTDIFSLGIVFFEMVTARRLFKRSTDLMTLKAITEEPLPEPRDYNSDVPSAVAEVIMRSLCRDPTKRYESARRMGQDLRRALDSKEHAATSRALRQYLRVDCATLLDAKDAMQQRLRTVPETGPALLDLDQEDSASHSSLAEQPTVAAGPNARRSGESTTTARSRSWWRLGLLGLLVVSLATLGGLAYRHLRDQRPPGPALRFGFPPSFPQAVGRRELTPLLRHLERKLGRRMELVLPDDYATLRAELLSGKLHFANLPPLQLVLARHRAPGLRVLVTHSYEGARSYDGYIIAGQSSGITSVAQLRGKRFCYVDRGSTSGYLYVRQHLRKQGLDPDKLFATARFSGDHINVMRDIIEGRCDAGAVYSGAMLSSSGLGVKASRLRMIAITGRLPYDAVCASPHTPRKVVERLRQLLQDLDPRRDLGRPIVGPTYRISGFSKVEVKAFEIVEQAARAEGLLD